MLRLSGITRGVNYNFNSTNSTKVPLLNEASNYFSSYLNTYGQILKKRSLMNWYKTIPELTAMVNKIAKDMCTDFHFETLSSLDRSSTSGRNKLLNANRFAQEVFLKRVLLSQVIDMLVTGEGFGWMARITKEQLKSKISSSLSNYEKLKTSPKLFKYLENKIVSDLENSEGIDEDLLKPRKFRYIPSSTMEIVYDRFDVIGYNQKVFTGGVSVPDSQVQFSPDEILRLALFDVDGKVSGFTPVEAIIVQLELLRQMWQNMLSIHKNGGGPDKLFILENTKISTPEYKRIEEQLNKYKLVENKHGNMVFTGKVTVEDLQQLDKMQFMDMGLYVTGLMAMQWQVPRSSIPYIVGGTNTKDDTGGNSEKGYWDNIRFSQEIIADLYNTQLFIPFFKVKLVFGKKYVQADVQAETYRQLMLNNVLSMEKILNTSGKTLSQEKKLEVLDLTEYDIEDMSEEQKNVAFGIGEESQPKKESSTIGKQNRNAAKKDEQSATEASRGMKPTGVGK